MTGRRATAPPDPAPAPTRGSQPNPFKKPEAIEPTVMALISGAEKIGKTYLALKGAPRPLIVIDSEGSGQFYADREGFTIDLLLHTRSYRKVIEALDYIETNLAEYKGGTLVVDTISVFYSVLQDAAVAARTAQVVAKGGDPADVDIEQREWGRIKRLHKALMARLMNLGLNVVVVSREKDIMERRDGQQVKVGVKPEADKGIGYDFALLVHLEKRGSKRFATVLGDWSGIHGDGAEIADPTWVNLFAPLLKRNGKRKATATRSVQSEEAAAHEDATSMGTKLATPLEVAAVVEALIAAGQDPDELRARKGWPPYGELGSVRVKELIAWAKGKANGKAPGAPVQPTDEQVERAASSEEGAVAVAAELAAKEAAA